MDTKEGQVLNTNTLVRDLDRLFNRQTGYMRSKGYIVDVSTDINIDPTSGVLTVPLVEAHIDQIRILGNKKTKNVVVTRELLSRPGDVLDENKLQKDMTRVYNTGLFDQVGPYQLEPTDVGRVNVLVPVVEKKSGTVSVGVGYSSRSQLVGRAELAENNFRGLGERVSLQWEVGGITSQSSVELGFYEPYLDKNHTSLDLDLYDKVVYRFYSGSFGGGIGDTNQYTETAQGRHGGRQPAPQRHPAGQHHRALRECQHQQRLGPAQRRLHPPGRRRWRARPARRQQHARQQPVARRRRPELHLLRVRPRQHVHRGNVPTPLAPGRHNIGKFGLDLRRYISLQGPRKLGDFKSPKKVLAVRALLGYANSDVPFFEQYFLGGADSLRGSDTDRYWGNKLALFQARVAPAHRQEQQPPDRPVHRRGRRLGQHLPGAGPPAAPELLADLGLRRRPAPGHPGRPDPTGRGVRARRHAHPVQHRAVVLAPPLGTNQQRQESK